MAAITVFSGSTGLNNKVDPVRLAFDPDSNIGELAVAVNVDIDNTGRVSRRKGYEKIFSGNCHSLYASDNVCYLVVDDVLSLLHSDFSTTAIIEVTPGAKISYASVGSRVYFTNGHEKGYLGNGSYFAWEKDTYVGPETTKELYGPPIGTLLETYNGRMYIVKDEVLWYSEAFAYHAFELSKNFIWFEDKINMVRSIRDGIYVGTEKAVYFLEGTNPREFTLTTVANYPAIEGTDNLIESSRIGREDINKGILNERCAIWMSSEGICIGGPRGFFRNLTEKKLVCPMANEGTSIVINNDQYISVLKAPDW